MEWTSVDEALPDNTRRVMFFWRNKQGRGRTSLGFYARERGIEADWGEDASYDACDEDESGTMWLTEGWYEEAHIPGLFYLVMDVTHWMDIPRRPKAA